MKKERKNDRKKIKKRLLFSFLVVAVTALIIPLAKKIFIFSNEKVLQAFKPQKVEFEIESVYSNELQKNLSDFALKVIEQQKLSEFDLTNFCSTLKKNFKIIKDVACDFSQPEIAKLKILGSQPFCKINGESILASNGELFSFEQFNDFDSDCLPEVWVANEYKIESLFSFLKEIQPQIWQNFSIDYQKDTNIILWPKKQQPKKFCLLTDKDSLSDFEKIEWVKEIEKKFGEELKRRARKNRVPLFDLRFKKRLFLRSIETTVNNRGM